MLNAADLPTVLANATPAELAEIDGLLAYPGSFREFVDRANPKFAWHRPHIELANALQQVANGTIRRLMVFFPPQEGKSEETTRLFPAYYLTEHPDRFVGIGAYAFGLAKGFSRAARAYYSAVMHHAIDGDGLADDAAAVDEWRTTRGGGLWAVGRGGAATGKSAHLLIVDDPIKDRAEADSDTIRPSVNDWYKSVLNMRLQPDPLNAVVIIHTRWHEDDLAGHLLEMERKGEWTEGWTVLDLPGIAEPKAQRPDYPKTVKIWPDWRKPGEPLGGRYGINRYRQVQYVSGSREYLSQVQQRPSAAGGTIFKKEWWQFITPDEMEALRFDRLILSLDAAFKDQDDSDFVALHAYGRKGTKVYRPYRVVERLSFTETVQLCRDAMKAYPDAILYVEDKANGPAIINTLRMELRRVLEVQPEGGKVARAYACQGDVEHGRVVLMTTERDGPFVRQAASFPHAPNDDDVDAFTQAMAIYRAELREALAREDVTAKIKQDDRSPHFNVEQKNFERVTIEKAVQQVFGQGQAKRFAPRTPRGFTRRGL